LAEGEAKLLRLLPAENGEPILAPPNPEERLANGDALLALPNVNFGMATDAAGCDAGAPRLGVDDRVEEPIEGEKMLL
jgi:hypothetical protein